jgi:glycerol-1-phosphate dehydrogenase [NAD(P)+]
MVNRLFYIYIFINFAINKNLMKRIEEALARARDTKALIIGENAISRCAGMFRKLFGESKAVIVADANTFKVAGEKTFKALQEAGIEMYDPFIFDDPELYAEWSYLMKLEEYLASCDAVAVAVGSGVINDLAKLSSEHLGRRYMIVGTAASMDGYTAYGASITFEGNKQTFDCRAPLGVVIEPGISAAAPSEMAASGYADLIAKVPAAADWMLADALGEEPIDEFAYNLLHDTLKESLSYPSEVHNREIKPTEMLAEGLIMSGFAMQAIQSSRPASGVEHQFSHYWDMEDLCHEGKHVSHGFKVGIGTLVSAACFEFILNHDMDSIDIEACTAGWPGWDEMENEIRTVFKDKPGHLSRALSETKAKYISADRLHDQLTTLKARWPELKEKISGYIFSYDHIYDSLRKVGAPYEPEMIGVSRERLRETFRGIPFMRSRYTIIDLIYRCGLMDEAEKHLFGPEGHWSI